MIVNPFSYLIEKLKGKVDKSGDTMTGDLTLGKASTVLKIRGADKYTNLTSNVTSSDKNIALPDKSGTIALTSDVPKTVKSLSSFIDLTTDANGTANSATISSLFPNYDVLACIVQYNALKAYGAYHLKYVWYYPPSDIIVVDEPDYPNSEYRISFTIIYTDK